MDIKSDFKGFLAEVRILPMLLMLTTTLLGGFFAVGPFLNWNVMALVLVNAFCFLYTAHLSDTFWDLRKGEYEKERKLHTVRLNDKAYLPRWGFGYEIPNAPILPKSHYLLGMALFSAIGVSIMLYISTLLDWRYSALAIIGLFLALTYSAGVDRIPALGDTWWEIGVLFALWCGYYSMKLTIDLFIIQTAMPLFLCLVSVKAQDSLPDTVVDNRINKQTLTVFLYRKGVSLSKIRHITFIPLYAGFLLLLSQAPPPLVPGVIITLVSIILNHVGLRKDLAGRWTIVATGCSILFFICYALLIISGLLF